MGNTGALKNVSPTQSSGTQSRQSLIRWPWKPLMSSTLSQFYGKKTLATGSQYGDPSREILILLFITSTLRDGSRFGHLVLDFLSSSSGGMLQASTTTSARSTSMMKTS